MRESAGRTLESLMMDGYNIILESLLVSSHGEAGEPVGQHQRLVDIDQAHGSAQGMRRRFAHDINSSCSRRTLSHRSLTSSKVSVVWLRTCCLMMLTRIALASYFKWKTSTHVDAVLATGANAGIIFIHANEDIYGMKHSVDCTLLT